jgi:ketosteroid isomerase-like protein
MIKETGDFSNNWHKSMKSLNQQPFAMFPLRIKGSNEDIVFSISQEEREWKNGSKQKLYLFEMFTINKAGKISDFKQFQNLPSTNEFGLAEGGKIYLKDSTATFTFSNRGEVETIEKMAVAFNKLDGESYSNFFADSIKYYHSNGTVEKFSKKGWVGHINKMKSANWKIKFLQYSYGLDGKITSVNSFGKDVKPASKEEKMATIKAEIIALEKSWDTHFNSGDLNSLLSLYADDAIRLPNNQSIISGKEAIKKEMEIEQTKLKKGYTNTSETTDVFGDENTVTEVGRTIRKDASGKVKSTGKYITIWKKVNGKFVTAREMWNDDAK